MRNRCAEELLSLPLSFVLVSGLAAAQVQNPIKAAKDAYNKAKQQQQQQTQVQTPQPAPPQAAPAAPGTPSAGTPVNVDVVGIKLGMAAKDAMLAVKADNPRLPMTPASFMFEGFADPLVPLVDSPPIGTAAPQAAERVQILFTTPPSQQVVWGVTRYYTFPIAERPSMQTILDALRKKYGPETVPPGTTSTLVWIYDAQGRLMGPSGARLKPICESTLGTYVGDLAQSALKSDIVSPRAWPPECTSIIVVTAHVSGAQIAANDFAASSLDVTALDGARYRAALDATRAVILNAAKARQQKQADEVNKRPAPKL